MKPYTQTRRPSQSLPFMDINTVSNSPIFYPQKSKVSHSTCIFCMATDGENIYLSGLNGAIQIWKANGEPGKLLKGHKDLITSMTILKNKTLLSSSDDGSVIHWDTKLLGICLNKYSASEKSISCCEVLYDKSLTSLLNTDLDYAFIGGSWDNNLYLWNPRNSTPAKVLAGHNAPVKTIQTYMTASGLKVASGANNGEIIIWDLKQFAIVSRFSAHAETVTSLKIHDEFLISSGQDNKVKFWDVNTLEQKREFAEEAAVRKFFLFRKSYMIVLAGVRTLEIWNLKTQNLIEKRESKDIVSEVTVMDDNNILVARRNEVNVLKYVNKKLTTIQAVHKFRVENRYPPIIVKLVHEMLFHSKGSM